MRVAAEVAKLKNCLFSLSSIAEYITDMMPKVEACYLPDNPTACYVGFCFLVIGKLREQNQEIPQTVTNFVSLFMHRDTDPVEPISQYSLR